MALTRDGSGRGQDVGLPAMARCPYREPENGATIVMARTCFAGRTRAADADLDHIVADLPAREPLAGPAPRTPQQGRGEPHSHSGLARHLTPALAQSAAALLESGSSYFFSIRSVGGAVSDVPAAATAYGWREANFSVAAFGTRGSGFDRGWQSLVPHMEGMYLSFESATGSDMLARAFPPAHLARLRELKRRYDSTGLFRDNFFIDPSVPAAAASATKASGGPGQVEGAA